MISKKLKLPRFDIRAGFAARASIPIDADEIDEHVIRWNLSSIYKKISDPFNKAHLTADLLRIDFTPAERNLLKNIGVSEWYVPHPDKPDARIAHAVIAGDHSINYNHPDGFAKIALIRGPDTEALFEDPTVLDSLDSAVASFADSFRVLLPEVQPMAIAGLRRTQAAVERVTAIMRELFSGVIIGTREICVSGAQKVAEAIERAHERHPELFIVDTTEAFQASEKSTEKAVENVALILQEWLDSHGGTLPFNPKSSIPAEPGSAKLPFWNAPLVYPERDSNGILNLDTLSELQRNQFYFAGRIRDIAVELLRAEQWIY